MKTIIDRSDISRAVKQAQEDNNLPTGNDFKSAYVKMDIIRKRFTDEYMSPEEMETALRGIVIDVYNEAADNTG